MSFHRDVAPLASLSLLLALGASCGGGGGGGGGSAPIVVSGTVRSPGGQAIALTATRERRTRVGPPARVDLPGLAPVPDFTPVDLVRVDASGAPLVTLASSVTVGGTYTFDLDDLNVDPATSLLVTAGTGAARMRAFAVEPRVDVDPLNEAVVQVVLQQGVALEGLTNKEASDFRAAVELLAVTQALAALGDVPATVDLVRQRVLAQPDLLAYLGFAAAPGQTDEGPGDVGDYFAFELGNAWGHVGTLVEDGLPATPFESAQRVVARDPFGVLTLEESNLLDEGDLLRTQLRETTAAIAHLGNDDPMDPLAAVGVWDEVRFPVREGERRTLFDVADLPLGADLDGDGTEERLAAVAERTTVGFETVSVAAGEFDRSLRLDSTLETTVRLSGGGSAVSTATTREWFAPGVGPVRAEGSVVTRVGPLTSELEFGQELESYLAGDVGHGILPARELATGLSEASSNADQPGRPGLAFDGVGFLLVTCRDTDGSAELVGVRVSAKGLVEDEFPIVELESAPQCRPSPAVAFVGTSYLVVYVDQGQQGQRSRVRGIRVTPEGLVLDPGGFDIATSGSSSSHPAVAFDGAKAFVVWRRFDSATQGDVYGTVVLPNGSVLDELPVHEAPGDQAAPDVAFGGGIFVVVWEDHATSPAQLVAARVSSLGSVIDRDGIVVSSEPAAMGELAPRASFDGTNFFVAWLRSTVPGIGHTHVIGTRFGVLGFPDVPLPIHTVDGPHESLDVLFDGTNHVVVWDTLAFDATGGVHLARVSPAGQLVDAPADGPARKLASPPPTGRVARPALALGNGRTLLAWAVVRELSGTTKDVSGTLIFPF